MSLLQALDRHYERLAAVNGAVPQGCSREKISFVIALSPCGEPVATVDLRERKAGVARPRLLEVPAPPKRTAGVRPSLFWDKTTYALGRDSKDGPRVAKAHAAFRAAHFTLLGDAQDPGLEALIRFLRRWRPERFDAPPFFNEMLDSNVVFQLQGDDVLLHERPAARERLASRASDVGAMQTCLITGVEAPVQRLHPTIKGVDGAQVSGASLISFNLDPFNSYGKAQGENAPTSERAAFQYGAALNHLLERGGPHRLSTRIGDATTIFWADAAHVGEQAARAAEGLFARWMAPEGGQGVCGDGSELNDSWRSTLREIAAGRSPEGLDLRLERGLRFHLLGLSPNAARVSVRYWLNEPFEVFAQRLVNHFDDLAIEPRPWRRGTPSIARLLAECFSAHAQLEDVPPRVAGELIQAVLGGERYPRTLLTAAIIRLRVASDRSVGVATDPVTGWRVAAIRAVLERDKRLDFEKEHTPVSLEREHPNTAYQLGRMFAALEIAQQMARGGRARAGLRDRYYGAASATPARVFPLLLRGARGHLDSLRAREKRTWIEKQINEISGRLPPEFPRALRLEAQGRFAIGYYHQRTAQFERAATGVHSSGDDHA